MEPMTSTPTSTRQDKLSSPGGRCFVARGVFRLFGRAVGPRQARKAVGNYAAFPCTNPSSPHPTAPKGTFILELSLLGPGMWHPLTFCGSDRRCLLLYGHHCDRIGAARGNLQVPQTIASCPIPVKHDRAPATSLMYIGPTSHSMTASPPAAFRETFRPSCLSVLSRRCTILSAFAP
jgi:hypothetical protein